MKLLQSNKGAEEKSMNREKTESNSYRVKYLNIMGYKKEKIFHLMSSLWQYYVLDILCQELQTSNLKSSVYPPVIKVEQFSRLNQKLVSGRDES